MGRRHLARELALKVLFELESDGGDVERSLKYHVAESRAVAQVAGVARVGARGGAITRPKSTSSYRKRPAIGDWTRLPRWNGRSCGLRPLRSVIFRASH